MKTGSLLLAVSPAAGLPSLAAAQAQPGPETLVVGLSADASTFEPGEIRSMDNSNIARLIYTALTRIDDEGNIVPRLATGWTISDDGTRIEFTLPEGYVCEDGEPLTAEDVAYSWNRAADPANAFAGNTPGFVYTSMAFAGAEVVDDQTVAILSERDTGMGLGFTSQVFIHCKDSFEAMSLDEIARAPVASGEYRLAEWNIGSGLMLEKWQGAGNFETIAFRVIPEASTRIAELLAGNVDIITNVLPDQSDLINASGVAEVQVVQGLRRMYIGFNQSEIFDGVAGEAVRNEDVRRALQYAVDVPAICLQLLNFECERATGLVNPPNGHPDIEPYPYDPETAERLLDEAGYPRGEDGVRFEITLQSPRGRYLNDANVALAVGAYLTEVGVATEVELLEWASVYTPLIRAHDAGPLFLLGSGGALWSVLYDMAILATVESGPNYTDWSDPRWFDRWADIAAAETLEQERAVIDEMLQVFFDYGPWLHMYYQPDFYGVSNRIKWTARRDEHIELWDVTLAE
ncbi:ABC transporter substrate-binding protein [Roseicitreum antarcticum]|uniref:Peptide/nickel transport system substrate-binding protein n=1 Tax=Roseicitreum antarcticum TaxID=564137 RepID=A0A1H3D0A0_9RHOB|nr:ABC transporter substrate-binding protein [Roseicitreum antarcticum]SDX59902.1 peptide/nickel transport system substrate-binding protein [Roseicitreum antarcticum]